VNPSLPFERLAALKTRVEDRRHWRDLDVQGSDDEQDDPRPRSCEVPQRPRRALFNHVTSSLIRTIWIDAPPAKPLSKTNAHICKALYGRGWYTTLSASDRDVFIFLVDDRNPISFEADGVKRNLFRGFMVWNSEVGSHRFGLMTFLYNFVCDNRIVWGAREVKEIAIRHTRNAPERFSKEALPRLYAYAESSVMDVEEQLARAARKTVTGKDEDVLSWLRSHDFTKKEGESIIEMAKSEEGGARTVWQLVQGGTALARKIPHADERVTFERRVSGLLKAA
jgi:Domain of unknown function (DUF932)